MKNFSRTEPRESRFFNNAIYEISIESGWKYEEYFYGWLVVVSTSSRQFRAYGTQLPVNTAVSAALAKDKSATSTVLRDAGIDSVPTGLVLDELRQSWGNGSSSADVALNLLKECVFPIVVKPNESSSGKGVTLCENVRSALDAINELLKTEPSVAVQPYLSIQSEERWIVFDGEVLLQFEKLPAPQAENEPPMFNLSRGGHVAHVNMRLDDQAIRALVKKVVAALGLRIAAVDIVFDSFGKPTVLEVNSGISFEHFFGTSQENRRLAKDVYRTVMHRVLTAK